MKNKLHRKVYYQDGEFQWRVFEDETIIGSGVAKTYLDAWKSSNKIYSESSRRNKYKVRTPQLELIFKNKDDRNSVISILNKFKGINVRTNSK